MKDHNDYLPQTKLVIKDHLMMLNKYGDNDASLNYLYFMRDEINKQIKEVKKVRKV